MLNDTTFALRVGRQLFLAPFTSNQLLTLQSQKGTKDDCRPRENSILESAIKALCQTQKVNGTYADCY